MTGVSNQRSGSSVSATRAADPARSVGGTARVNGQKRAIPCNRPVRTWRRESIQAHLPRLIVVCFGRFWVRDLPFPNARRLGQPFQWKNTLPWHLGPAAKVRILRFKNLSPFRHYRGLQNHV
jgi:hypothetical protein